MTTSRRGTHRSPATRLDAGAPLRYPGLDGLRGAAALVVLLDHGLLVIPDLARPLYGESGVGGWSWLVYTPLHVFWAGTEAVVVFFVLSGFVLSIPVLRAARFDWRAYYPSRLLRLYLPVWASLIWAVALVSLLPRHLDSAPSLWMRSHAGPLSVSALAHDALLIGGSTNLNGPLWSLRYEVLFSLTLPLYLLAAARVRRHSMLAGAAIVLAIGVTAITPWGALRYMLTFGIGVLMATHVRELVVLGARLDATRRARLSWAALALTAMATITAPWTIGRWVSLDGAGLAESLTAVGAAILVFLALACPAAIRLLRLRPMAWLGSVSFSLYLFHEPVVVAIAQILPSWARNYTAVVAVPVSLAVGYAFFRLVERPSHKLSQAVRRTVASRRNVGNAAASALPVDNQPVGDRAAG